MKSALFFPAILNLKADKLQLDLLVTCLADIDVYYLSAGWVSGKLDCTDFPTPVG
jgi:hypothetical protein